MPFPSRLLSDALRHPANLWQPGLLIFALNSLYHLLRDDHLLSALSTALPESLALTLLYVIGTQLSLVKASVFLLALPYAFFIPGWLNTPAALFTGAVTVLCFVLTIRSLADSTPGDREGMTLPAFLLIVVYVNLSGVGGYGYQSPDHSMHNSRLADLITNPWPVHYDIQGFGEKHLVYYMGYFLPAAVIGKLTSYDTAKYFLYLWAIFAMTLAFRWLQCLANRRLTAGLVGIFMIFGTLDLLNTWLAAPNTVGWLDYVLPMDIGLFEFITREIIGVFVGNYLSHTLQLYFAPHQVIAGWIGAGLLAHLYLSRQASGFLFAYALLCLWSPFVMLGLAPLVIVLALHLLREHTRALLSIPNILGAAVLLSLFVVFYISGSAEKNPSFSLLSQLHTPQHYLTMGLWFLAGWGMYALLLLPAAPQLEAREKILLAGLLLSLALLPAWIFGSYNDLLCRGNAPLMFLLLAFLLKAWTLYQHQQSRALLLAMGFCIAVGSLSALQQHIKAIYFYGQQQAPSTVTGFKYGWENLGSDNSIFGKYLRAD